MRHFLFDIVALAFVTVIGATLWHLIDLALSLIR